MKKGFVVYFDNGAQTAHLPDALYAAVWRAVFRYAELLAAGQDAEGELQTQLSQLPVEAAMALRFISDTVRRDHGRYRSRTEQYRAARGKEPQEEGYSMDPEMAKWVRRLVTDRKKQQSEGDAWKWV